MDVGWLLRRWQALRISHGREIAVIGVTDPARAWQIGAVFASAAAANHRLAGGVDEIGLEAFAGARKALPIEFRIGLRTSAEAVIGKCCLMRVDKGHAVGARIAAQDAGLAQRERFQLRQEFVFDEIRYGGEPLRLRVEGGMDIEAGAAAGAGRPVTPRRIGIGDIDHARQVGDQRPQGLAQFGKILRFEGRYERNTGLALEGFYSFGRRPAGENHHTAQGVAGVKKKDVRAGAQYIRQQRQSGEDGVPDQRIDIWSGFVVWDVLPKKADLFLRVDGVQGSAGGAETGLPGADGIDYWLMSPQSNFTTWIFGGEWYVHPSFRLGPNLELAKYANDPDPVNFPGRDQDSIFRVTFFWTF